jgi:hypothetical protein
MAVMIEKLTVPNTTTTSAILANILMSTPMVIHGEGIEEHIDAQGYRVEHLGDVDEPECTAKE